MTHDFPPHELPGASEPDFSEAFLLMRYQSPSGELEWIWNSRNGITPFIVHSRDGEEMQHVRWCEDPYMPLHVPNLLDRVFVDLTLEHARIYRRQHVERDWSVNVGSETEPIRLCDRWPTKDSAVEDLAAGDVEAFGGRPPNLLVVDAELRAYFAARALYLAETWMEPKEPRHLRVEADRRAMPRRFA
jgi:hypothetical protein